MVAAEPELEAAFLRLLPSSQREDIDDVTSDKGAKRVQSSLTQAVLR